MSTLLESLKWRHATKRYNGQTLEEEKLKFILDAIRLSASSLGLQPYKVLVISNKELKEKLREASFNQAQITESSHLLVFAARTSVDEKYINDFIELTAKTRNQKLEDLDNFKNYLIQTVNAKPKDELLNWTARQSYIALGTGLAAAAELRVNASPMEGFENEKYDQILELEKQGLHATVLLALGYRSDEDWLAPLTKVRKDNADLFEYIS